MRGGSAARRRETCDPLSRASLVRVPPFGHWKRRLAPHTVEGVFLCGIPVSGDNLVALAKLVKDPELAAKLVDGVQRDVIAVRLDGVERATVLKALAEPPGELEHVRDTLLANQARDQAGFAAVDDAA
jgi:hypothetical protein